MWGIAGGGGGGCTGGPTGGTRCCVLVCGAWRRLWRTVCEEREPWGRWSWVRGGGGGAAAAAACRSPPLRIAGPRWQCAHREDCVPGCLIEVGLRLTAVRKWITDGRVVREEQRDASGGLTIRCASVAFAAR